MAVLALKKICCMSLGLLESLELVPKIGMRSDNYIVIETHLIDSQLTLCMKILLTLNIVDVGLI